MTDYDFRSLSPIDFEALVRDIFTAEFGVPFETFAVGPDGGVDLRHTGLNGTIVVQCKHRPAATKAQIVSSAADELARWSGKLPEQYYFVTSAALSPDAVAAVSEALGALVPDAGHVWSRGRLNGCLSTHQEVERRHFKLWLASTEVLDRVLRSGEWERSEALLHQISDRVRLYVDTPKYGEALETLHAERVVLIAGAPGVGKSTLAEMLLLAHWNAGWNVVNIVADIGEAWPHVRDPDKKTVIYYDDFLGQTSSIELQKNEGNDLALLIATLRKSTSGNVLLVLTTREQILNVAVAGPDDRIRRAIEGEAPLRVEMAALSRHDRARILFNHLYFAYAGSPVLSDLSRDIRYRKVVDHPGFNPRVLESVVLAKRPETADALYSELQEALDHPDLIWKSSFDQLSQLGVRILLHLAIEPMRSVPVSAIEPLALSEDPRQFSTALRILEGAWIRIDQTDEGPHLRLYDPSRKDFLLDQLESGPLFKQCLVDTTTVHQVEQLVSYRVRRPIGILVERMAEEIDEVASERLKAGLDDQPMFSQRVELLASAVEVMTSLPSSERLSEALMPAFAFLDADHIVVGRSVASKLFQTATGLDRIGAEWAQERAEQCVMAGLENIEESEEIREFAELPHVLRSRLPDDDLNAALEEVFDRELDGIGQQSDPDLMGTWLDEIEHLAEELGISLYTDSLRERIDELPTSRPSDYGVVKPVVEAASIDDSDAGLSQLFARLADPDAL